MAQLAEHLICNEQVAGSIPARGSIGKVWKLIEILKEDNTK